MGKICDFIINLLRWPVAFLILLNIPALATGLTHFNFYSIKFYAFGAGAIFYIVTAFMSGAEIRSSMQIISHELTHAFFAYLTFHWVGRIRLNPDDSGGSMTLRGRGNWLISLSPYFFPLFTLLYMLIMPTLLKSFEGTFEKILIYAIFGYFTAYYWATVLSQVHSEQTDIINEGFFFSGIIIIGGNLLVNGIIFAFCTKLWDGVNAYGEILAKINMQYIEALKNLLG